MSRKKRDTRDDIPEHLLPTVAIVGRPNVGKSTLFNRLTGTRRAAIFDTPGVTRDRNYGVAEWAGRRFRLIDTGGFEADLTRMPLLSEMREQALIAVQEADSIILLVDIDETDNPTDAELVALLRKSEKPFFLGVNKCEKNEEILNAYDFARLGVDQVYPISSLEGNGTGELLDDLVEWLPEPQAPEEPAVETEEPETEGAANEEPADRWARQREELESRPIRLAIVGRQNVGKSTLVNQLLGETRVIASPIPGTTRDAIDTPFRSLERDWVLIDTAGIRRRGKQSTGIEGLSAMSSMFSMERADVAALLLDATEGVTAQDKHVAGYAVDRGCCLVIGVNKWDAVKKDHRSADEFTKKIHEEMPFIDFAPIVYLSALTGQRASKVLGLALEVYTEACRRIETPALNDWLQSATGRFPPPVRENRRLSLKFARQTGVLPPSFAVFCNDPKLAHFSYRRYLLNNLRETFDLGRVPIRLYLKKKGGPKREFPHVLRRNRD